MLIMFNWCKCFDYVTWYRHGAYTGENQAILKDGIVIIHYFKAGRDVKAHVKLVK